MYIRSLLLGSAAAMVAVSGAQAADAIVVEPEPVEYVRICDAYGSGYFYIPGTETCLRFSGYVRTYFASRDYDSVATAGGKTRKSWVSRARLDVTTRNETDWGTVSAGFRYQSNGNVSGDGVGNDGQAWISLDTGTFLLRAGNADSYWATNHGYSGVGGIQGVEGSDGPYGFVNSQFLDVTVSPIDGLSVTVGVEDITAGASAAAGVAFNTNPNSNGDSLDGQGNFYAGFNYSMGIFGLAFTAAHDDSSVVANRGWAYRASLDIDVSEFIPGGNIHGKYVWEDLDGPVGGGAHTGYTSADQMFQIGFNFNVTDNLVFGATYYNLEDTTAIGQDVDFIGFGFNWEPVDQLQIFGEYSISDTTTGATTADFDQWAIGLRRNF